jgi:hypothetical protein
MSRYIRFFTAALGMALEIVDNRIDIKNLVELVEHDY